MPRKLADLEMLFAGLGSERAELEQAIERMIGEMAGVPPEDRAARGWADDGPLTRQFLEATNRQAELEAELETVSRAIADAKDLPRPH